MNPTKRLGTGRSSTFVDTPGGAGGLEWLQTVEALADTPTLTVPGLDGDVDGIYLFLINLIPAADATVPVLRPNGLSTNLTRVGFYVIPGFAPQDPGAGSRVPLYELGDPTPCSAQVILYAKSGKRRFFQIRSTLFQAGAENRLTAWQFDGMWNETVTNITSLDLTSNSAGNGILQGSKIQVYRFNES